MGQRRPLQMNGRRSWSTTPSSSMGEAKTFSQVVEMERKFFREHVSDNNDCPPPTALPILHEVVSMIANAPVKAIGEDLLGSEVFKSAPHEVAGIWLPLACRAVLSKRPPAQWTGGMPQDILKKGRAPTRADSYREVCLADFSAKLFGKFLRGRLISAARESSLDTPLGAGFNGGEPVAAHLLMKRYFDVGRAAAQSAAVLCVDLVTAFASVRRDITFGADGAPRLPLCKLRELG